MKPLAVAVCSLVVLMAVPPTVLGPFGMIVWCLAAGSFAASGAVFLNRVHEAGLLPALRGWSISPDRMQVEWIRSGDVRRAVPVFDRGDQ